MDPNLFHVDWAQLFEVMAAVVVLSFVVERGLALVFEHRWYVAKFKETGLKAPIAFGVSLLICAGWNFDLISVLLRSEQVGLPGMVLTAGVIAGGSKASIKLFRDLMDVQSDAARAANRTSNSASKIGAEEAGK